MVALVESGGANYYASGFLHMATIVFSEKHELNGMARGKQPCVT